MGQKVHPVGFRLKVNKTWSSNWFDESNFADKLEEDLMLRKYLNKRLQNAGVAKIEIERTPKLITISIHTARPGIVIGRRGTEVDKLKAELAQVTGKDVQLNIFEIKRPEIEAALVAESIAHQLKGRVSFRRAMKKSIQAAMRMGAEGIKVNCKGRLGGAEMSRKESYKEGRIPLHTLRADIDYHLHTAMTTYGTIGVKVWVCKGEILGNEVAQHDNAAQRTDQPPRRGKKK
ncbi:30S ribosomal protein S3 [bacterium]|nr:30S ribosomal protein S3 [bacterium]